LGLRVNLREIGKGMGVSGPTSHRPRKMGVQG
jgi:hypothetical protein